MDVNGYVINWGDIELIIFSTWTYQRANDLENKHWCTWYFSLGDEKPYKISWMLRFLSSSPAGFFVNIQAPDSDILSCPPLGFDRKPPSPNSQKRFPRKITFCLEIKLQWMGSFGKISSWAWLTLSINGHFRILKMEVPTIYKAYIRPM